MPVIPKSGEARVLAELKGAFGARGGKMRRGKSKFQRLRKPRGKNPFWALARFPGIGDAAGEWTSDEDTPTLTYRTPGSASLPISLWALALSPELHPMGESTAVEAPIEPSGSDGAIRQIEPRGMYRVVGVRGSLYWTPLATLQDPPDGTAYSGFVMGAWYKVEKKAGGTLLNEFPWGSYSVSDSQLAGGQSGFRVGIQEGSRNGTLGRDPRLRYDMMGSFCKPWRMDIGPGYVNDGGGGDPIVTDIEPSWAVGHAVKIPIPKPVWNIGRGEAVGLILTFKDNSPNRSAPLGILTQDDLRFRLIELD